MAVLLDNEFAAAAVIVLLVAGVAAAFAWLFRVSHTPGRGPGAAVLGGICAGLLLGQTGGARLAPGAHETLLLGGRDERLAYEQAERRLQEELTALRQTGVTGVELERHRRVRLESPDGPRERREAWIQKAQQRHWTRVITAALAGAVVALLLSQTTLLGARGAPERRSALAAGVGAGLSSALFAGALTALFTRLLVFPDRSWPDGLLLGGALAALVAVGSPFAGLSSRRIGPPSRRKGIERAGGAGLAIVAIALGGASAAHPIALLPVAALLGGAAVGWLARGPLRSQRLGEKALSGVAAPLLAALATLPIDLAALGTRADFWWLLVIAVVFAGDGRWLGGWLGWWLFGGRAGRGEAWTRSAAMCNARVGLVSLVLLAPIMPLSSPATTAWLASPWHAIGAAAIFAALLVEITSGARRMLAPRLDRGEPFEPPSPA